MNTVDTRDLQTRLDELESLRDAVADRQTELEETKAEVVADSEENAKLDAIADRETALELAQDEFGEDEQAELKELESLSNEISDFRDGAQMIPVEDFEKYAQDLAEDIGAISRNESWPLNHIDWTAAASALADDYTEVSYQGADYYVRA